MNLSDREKYGATVCAMIAEMFLGFTRTLNPVTSNWEWRPPNHRALSEAEQSLVLTEPPPLCTPQMLLEFQALLVGDPRPGAASAIQWEITPVLTNDGNATPGAPLPRRPLAYKCSIARQDGLVGSAKADNPWMAIYIAALDLIGEAKHIEQTRRTLFPSLKVVR